jgi:hypothetical protein
MNIGLDGPEDHAMLEKTLSMIHLIGQMHDSLPADAAHLGQPGSDLADLIVALPEPPVDLRMSIVAGLESARGALSQISSFIQDGIPTTLPVLQTLVRSALLGAGRVVYVLGPSSPQAREDNARMVLRQEAKSLMRAYSSFEQFKQLLLVVPPADVVAAQRERNDVLQRGAAVIGEEKTLMAMASVVAETLTANGFDSPEGVPLEIMSWIFNVYSGVAHGFGWPRLVPDAVFVADLHMVTCVAHLAFDLTSQRSTAAG